MNVSAAAESRAERGVAGDAWTVSAEEAAAPAGFRSASYLRDMWAAAETLFADTDGPPPPDRLRWMCGDFQDFFARVGTRSQLVFRACLACVSWVSPLLIGRVPPLRRHDVATRTRAMERLEHSPLAMSVLGVKAMMAMIWYEHPASARDIGFDGKCRGTEP